MVLDMQVLQDSPLGEGVLPASSGRVAADQARLTFRLVVPAVA
jgi:hypothetical protein